MNDRFKYRAWDKETKSFLIHNEEDKTFDFNVFNSVLNRPEKYDILQCTGMKDKNGKLVFEGDIVTYDSRDIFPHTTVKKGNITWHKFYWVISYLDKNILNAETKKPALQRIWLGIDDFINSRTEVIGNIYENSELLQECE